MSDVQDLLETAHETEASGDTDGAIRIYESILNHQADHAATLHALGALMNRRGDFRRAKEFLERAVVLRPGDPVRHVDLGESYRNLGEYHHAVGSCRMALKLFPEYPEGLITLGLALQGAGDLRGHWSSFAGRVHTDRISRRRTPTSVWCSASWGCPKKRS